MKSPHIGLAVISKQPRRLSVVVLSESNDTDMIVTFVKIQSWTPGDRASSSPEPGHCLDVCEERETLHDTIIRLSQQQLNNCHSIRCPVRIILFDTGRRAM